MQNAEPIGLYCADETDGESAARLRADQESLYAFEVGGTDTVPALATECTANEDLTVWTCTLRDGVTFHDGATFDANDVVTSYAVQWDAANPLHVGRDGSFAYFPGLLGRLPEPAARLRSSHLGLDPSRRGAPPARRRPSPTAAGRHAAPGIP